MIELIKGANISPEMIEAVLSKHRPIFHDIKDKQIEENKDVPIMMYAMWGYICTHRHYPSQEQFLSYYLNVHAKHIKDNHLNEPSISARVLRTYPSLTREIHYYLLLENSHLFESVQYSLYDDVIRGVDITVELCGKSYPISCYVETKRGNHYRQLKYSRHLNEENHINMPLSFTNNKHNGWLLYTEDDVNELYYKVINLAWKKHGQHPLDLVS